MLIDTFNKKELPIAISWEGSRFNIFILTNIIDILSDKFTSNTSKNIVKCSQNKEMSNIGEERFFMNAIDKISKIIAYTIILIIKIIVYPIYFISTIISKISTKILESISSNNQSNNVVVYDSENIEI